MRRKDTRPITVLGNIWEYKIGRNTVAIYDPEGNRYFPKFVDIVGEKAYERKVFQLNPATILNYIQTAILDTKSSVNRCVSCKQFKADVILQVNPYQAELHGDYSEHFFCNSCYGDLADDI